MRYERGDWYEMGRKAGLASGTVMECSSLSMEHVDTYIRNLRNGRGWRVGPAYASYIRHLSFGTRILVTANNTN